MSNNMQVGEQGYVMTGIFEAPRHLVFEVWSSPEHLRHWWGPEGFTSTIQEFDLRIGGDWKFVMHGPDGTDYANHIVFTDIIEPEKITFWHKSPDFSATATFEEVENKTMVTYITQYKTPSDFDPVKHYVIPGGQQHFECLGAYLKTIMRTT
ncbi:SRPBCC domain-containing protein [Alicyclobacillus curvatus]|jgi:uncharacterized protein YndB with AHSA1/START domain|nr:SRPBCC domain-containing protein [Alicyclobacillus curvatus]